MKVLGLGDNAVDDYISESLLYPGGNAVNVAAHAALLGQESSYLGNLGDDAYAQVVRDGLDFAGVSYSQCPVVKGSHTKRCLYHRIDGERRYVGIDTGDLWSGPLALTPDILALMEKEKYQLIHSCANAKMGEEMHKLAGLSAVFTYDFSEKPKYRTDEYLSLICPALDLALFSCNDLSDEEVAAFARTVHAHGAKHVLITLGERGQYFFSGSLCLKNPANYVKAIDTMGAGDSFVACFAIQLMQKGWQKGCVMAEGPVRDALYAAAAYSAQNCMKEGGFGYKATLRAAHQ